MKRDKADKAKRGDTEVKRRCNSALKKIRRSKAIQSKVACSYVKIEQTGRDGAKTLREVLQHEGKYGRSIEVRHEETSKKHERIPRAIPRRETRVINTVTSLSN